MCDQFIGNRYRILRLLGQGGMGAVYHVEDTLMGSMNFALKTIKESIIKRFRTKSVENFKNEYEIMTRLKHPNLTRVFEFGYDNDNYYIVMEYLKGILLSDYIFYDIESKIDVIVEVLRALEFIHSRNIIYHDIKPQNIIISESSVKLMDFGLSGFIKEKDDRIRGTLLYLPPEVLKGNITFSADIFSLGIIFYELIANCLFYDTKNFNHSSIIKILNDVDSFNLHQKTRLKLIDDHDIREIIQKMTAYNKDERYSTCSDIIKDINDKLNFNYEYETKETKESYVLGSSFTNRIKEMNVLKENILDSNEYKMFLCRGPAGIGKTRLFAEFKKYCRLNDIFFIETSCFEGNTNKYNSIGKIIQQMTIFSSEKLMNHYNKYISMISGDYNWLKLAHEERIEDPKVLNDIIVQNITDFILEFSREKKDKKIIIYFNDIQWIDEGSGNIIRNLLRRMDHLGEKKFKIVICASVNEEKKPEGFPFNDMLSDNKVKNYYIYPFDKTSVKKYLENVFGKMFLDRSIIDSADKIRDIIGGNPLFLQEFIRNLMSRNIIIKYQKYWKLLLPVDQVDIPDDITEIIKTKIDLVFQDKKKKKTLQILSLLRIDMHMDAVRSIMEIFDFHDTEKILHELQNLEIIQAVNIENILYYSFSNSIIKDYIRKSIKDNIKALSLLLARKLESISKTLTDDYNEEIGYHYKKARDLKKALYYYEISGDTARRNYFNNKALNNYETVLKLLAISTEYPEEKNIKIKLKILPVIEKIGKTKESEELIKECLKVSYKINNKKLMAESKYYYGSLKLAEGKYEDAMESFEESYRIFTEIGDKKGMQYIEKNKGNTFFRMGNYQKALKCYLQYKGISEELENKIDTASAISNIGSVYQKLGQYEKALECHEVYRKASEAIGHKEGIAGSIGNMGIIYYKLREYKKAIECHKTHLRISKEIGNKQYMAISLSNMGLAYGELGEYQKALKNHKFARKIFQEIGNKWGFGMTSANIGWTYYLLGHYIKAMKYFKIYKDISQELNSRLNVGIAIGFIGSVYYNTYDYDNALYCFEESIKIFDEFAVKSDQLAVSLLLKSRIHIKRNDIFQGKKTAGILLETAEAIKDPDYIKKAKILSYLIEIVFCKNSINNIYQLIMSKDFTEEKRADILYELYMIKNEDFYRIRALGMYKKLYERENDIKYKKIIDELKE